MKPRHPNVDWIKKVLADLEPHRDDPRIAPFLSDLAEPSVVPDCEPAQAPTGYSRPRLLP
jgi:hypothetical protein